ncbi:type I restriction enzyme R subunit [Roseivirga ehrenbergii]|uniref:Type I restriction enzyme endonuclease subunit n=1 Tax=Roseivirga ehrenbergii (strain DSM 102268 / JCM 13514 / KCTC 12282 / NCIMB 14502 / KMM 6017) TaxID=279360 RepID=A0A150X6Q7_ROSEK|nr:type I restriction endonuclease subunit R [Roseivirga ehrenbergii]KYG74429.1 type I restriction-modification system endonuclease [Roseivirga ehrenbergii]TCL14268.1 type I restriction enzyme R subunit [Roseivirga ehrenbergii]
MKESTVQQAAIEWLENLGYTYRMGNSLSRDLKKVVLEDELQSFLQKTYPDVPITAIHEAMAVFTQQASMDLDHRNQEFHRKMSQGIDISWKTADGKELAKHLYPINYDSPAANSFICADEVRFIGKNNRRTDLLIYINGLPLIVFEFKNMFDPEVGVDNALGQIGHYILDIPELFDYNAITVVSDGMETLHGMYNSSMEWFAPWKSMQGDDVENRKKFQLETLLNGLFPKATLLNYLKNFIFHEDHNGKIIKKGAKYHQFWGINKAVESAVANIKPHGDGRLGVIWHTQGSGKSISMAILTGILRSLPQMKNPTIVIQVDRSDLDQQLYENFVLAKDLVGEVQHAETTDELRALLSTDGGGVIFTTIEKFRLKELEGGKELAHPILSERYNLIVMADEAHRTQYGFKDGGFAQNIRIAMPNASFIGFTGTPVDSKGADTELVFGETIHTYDIKQAVEDGATVPIYYEPKMVPLNIKAEYTKELEAIAEDEDESTHAVWAAIEDAAGAEDRVKRVATDILTHFNARIASLDGKAMIVCMSRKNCVKMYDALTALEGCPEIAVIMTSNIGKDPKEWNPHVRTKDNMEAIKKRFKTADDPLKMVIVRDMWLTGFDAPCAHTMYVDKIMKGHNLMQAIARVNRVFHDKPNGLVVDFIGISGFLAEATKKYTGSGGGGKPTIDMDVAVEMCLAQFEEVKALMGGFDLEAINALSASEKLTWSNNLVNDLLQSDPITDKFLLEERKLSELVAMTNSDPRIWPIQEEVGMIQKIRDIIRKIKFPPGAQRKKNDRIKDLISQSIESHKIVDLAEMYDLDRIDISIIDDAFQAMVKDKGGENIKIELLRRIINDELKVRMPKNIRRMTSLKDELDKVLGKYHKNSLDSIAAIKHLLDIATEFQNDDKRTKELGLTEDELAFYDLLEANQKLLNEAGPIQDLVHKVVASVKKNLQLDWAKKEDARAAIRLAVKKELKGKVPFSALDQLLQEVIEQAEGQYSDWPMQG